MSIKVSVNNGKVSCDPDTYNVGKSNGTVVIIWTMKTKGYEISGLSGLPSPEFFDSEANGKTGWKIKDKNNTVKDYDYTVQVKKVATGAVTELDPIIRNGGQNIIP